MAGDVVITFGADDKEAVRALQNMQKQMENLKGQLHSLKATSMETSKGTADGWKSAALAIGSSLTGVLSVGTATAVVTRELQGQVDLYKEIARLQKQVAGPQANFIRNVGSDDPKVLNALISQLQDISKRTGVSQGVLYDAAGTASAAKGVLLDKDVLNATEFAARLAPDNPGELQNIAGGLLDLASLTKSADPRTNAGFMLRMGSQARVTNLQQISQNLVPGAIGAQGYGGTAGEAAALATTLTSAMKDATGATSGTATIALAGQLAAFLPEADRYEYDTKGKRKLARRGTGLDETDERIRYLQEHPQLREQFLAQASLEQKAVIPVRDLLTPGTETAKLFEQNAMGYGGNLSQQAEDFLRTMGSVDLQRTADLSRRATNVSERAFLEDTEAGRRGVVYDTYPEYQKAVGQGIVERLVKYVDMVIADYTNRSTGGRLGNTPAGTAMEQIRRDQSISGNDKYLKIQQEQLDVLRKIQEGSQRPVNIDAHVE